MNTCVLPLSLGVRRRDFGNLCAGGLIVIVVILEPSEVHSLEAFVLLGRLVLGRGTFDVGFVLSSSIVVLVRQLIVVILLVKAVKLTPDPSPATLVLATLLRGLARPLDAEADGRLASLSPETIRSLADDDGPRLLVGDWPSIKQGVPER